MPERDNVRTETDEKFLVKSLFHAHIGFCNGATDAFAHIFFASELAFFVGGARSRLSADSGRRTTFIQRSNE